MTTTRYKKYELSILIPVYNEEKTLRKILTSTTDLPINKYEVIIVDDASKDKSPQIIKAFAKELCEERDLGIPQKEWDNYEKMPCWVYSGRSQNEYAEKSGTVIWG